MADPTRPPEDLETLRKERQVIYWRLLTSIFDQSERHPGFDRVTADLATQVDMPSLVLDPSVSIDTLLQRFPDLRPELERPLPIQRTPDEDSSEAASDEPTEPTEPTEPAGPAQTPAAATADPPPPDDRRTNLRRALVFSKLLLNAFGPNTQSSVVTAGAYAQWTKDLGWLEQAFGYAPGALRGRARGSGGGGAGAGTGPGGGGGKPIAEDDLRAGFASMESDLIRRMALREVLKDNELAQKLTPSMALVEQLLRDKANLSGDALANAKRLIRAYVDKLAEVLKLQVQKAARGKIDRSIPPKRVYRNLDLKRTVWKNLTNWNPDEKRLYVDRLIYRRTAQKKTPTRLIVVVDQSGSMVDAMVQSTILASIFTGLPNVDVHLIAFDTRVLDLTPWVRDPFEVLLRTELGGGTLILQALTEAANKIVEPKNTAVVLISDFFEGGSDQALLDYIVGLRGSGVHFIPVGALTSSGYFSVSEFFRVRLKELGTPILSGSVNKLLQELRYLLK